MNGGNPSSELRIHPPLLPEEREEIYAFLREKGLEPETPGDADYAVSLREAGSLVAVGSLSGRIIKGVAVDEGLRGRGLATRVVSELEAEAGRRGIASILAFTSPGNAAIFGSFGYRIIAAAEGEAILLEKGGGLDDWCAGLAASVGPDGPRAVVVMNCNPFTLGHLHLVREAAKLRGRLAVIVVSEDASSFPYEARLRMVREGTAGIPGVVVLPGSDYIVSRATFPTYFLKDRAGRAAAVHARLDLDLFGRRIAPALGADVRFVGEEPYSEVTALYNATMKSVLPSLGIEVIEIPRLRIGGAAVSASTVRAAIRDGKLEDARSLVPDSTWGYLSSPEARPVLRAVAESAGRH